jgi:uncharacterized phage-associated protein
MMAHDARAVANRFIELARENGRSFTPMQLQKLVYISHGWNMALNDARPLIADDVQAWVWGPVIPEIYDSLKRYGSQPVTDLIHENEWRADTDRRGPVVISTFCEDEERIIRSVFSSYGNMSGGELSALTHEDGSPWSQVYRPNVRNIVIPNQAIETYYRELVDR